MTATKTRTRKPAPSADTVRAEEDAILQRAEEIARARLADREIAHRCTTPAEVRRLLTALNRNRKHEVFACLFLDSQHRVVAMRDLFTGTIDAASVYPREVVRAVLDHGAAAVILAHNHPSGVTEPSQADRAITRRLVDALALVDVRVLDHLIVGQTTEDAVSFAERGYL